MAPPPPRVLRAGSPLQLQLEQSVGVLTSEKRPVWHELRALLCRDQAEPAPASAMLGRARTR